MKRGLARFAFAAALVVAFLVALVALVEFLGQDACLDRGGAIGDAGYACHFSDGATATVASLTSWVVLALAAVALGVPLLALWFAFRNCLGRNS